MKTFKPSDQQPDVNLGRRSFLRYAGTGAIAATGIMALGACRKHNDDSFGTYDIGSGDIGILNYAYALEQLEAAFYIQVVATPYSGMTGVETSFLTDIRDHEVAHREFFKAALGTNAMVGLTPDFSAVNFSSRQSVLATALAFEDLGVAAYNGAGYLIQNGDYLTIAGKIVSVEARHAALIRNLVNYSTFGDGTVIDSNGSDKQQSIAQVLPVANTFLKTKVSAGSFNYIP